ncbi:uncharacterized protein PRCAT00004677001 [Priceomyces carsonii]|uniref:uncharacterized protein n=1 Tax=Priceomyces carsonii TaxID=28549 RepID=UPI002ED8CC68|nr:unnamed protein product [Priceomyces carsonii]
MTDNGVVIGSIVASIVGVFFITTLIVVAYTCCCCTVYVGRDIYRFKDLQLGIGRPRSLKQTKAAEIRSNFWPVGSEDEESLVGDNGTRDQTLSNIALRSVPMSEKMLSPLSSAIDGDILVNISKDDNMNTDTLAYMSAMDHTNSRCEVAGEGRKGFKENKVTSINYNTKYNSLKTIIAEPSGMAFGNYDQYDSFSRTLMLQKLIQCSKDKKMIRQVRDPFLGSFISLGGIVVAVESFHGLHENEFNVLQAGDLLRIVKFYIKDEDEDKEINKSLRCTSRITSEEIVDTNESTDIVDFTENLSSQETMNKHSEIDIVMDTSDLKYDEVYCTGIILNTYLEYDANTSNLSLRFRESPISDTQEKDLVKDFPLRVISLETTVLKNIGSPKSIK